jgi:hypothetical protein
MLHELSGGGSGSSSSDRRAVWGKLAGIVFDSSPAVVDADVSARWVGWRFLWWWWWWWWGGHRVLRHLLP